MCVCVGRGGSGSKADHVNALSGVSDWVALMSCIKDEG